jgi:hypothetical protein
MRTCLRLGLWGWGTAASLTIAAAWAQEAKPPASPPPASPPAGPSAVEVGPSAAPPVQPGVLSVRVETTAELTEADFLAALFRTLRRPLVLASADPPSDQPRLTVRFDSARRELFVACYEPSRGTVTRVIDPPADPKAVPEAAALLADNLCTDQLEAPSIAPVAAVAAPPAPPAAPPPVEDKPAPKAPKPRPRPHLPVAAGLFYPLASNYEKPDVRTNLQLNLLYGRIGQLDGLSIGVVNAIEENADGLTLALLVNRAGGRMSGLAVGGVNSFGSVETGASLAFGLNHSSGVVRGGQAAFGLNFADAVEGGQAAGLLNVASGRMQGLQAAFGANVATGAVAGAQFATIVNVGGDVDGVQAALVNVAGHVRGMQIGLVNVAEEVEGVPLGLVNVTESGGVHVAAWAGYSTRANLGLKFATRYTYSMITAGHYRTGKRDAFGPGLVFGVRVPVHDEVSVALDVGGDYLFGTRFCCYRDQTEERIAHTRDRNHFRLRVLPTWQPKPHFALFAGGGVALKVPFAAYSGLDGYDQAVELEPELAAGIEL